METCIKMNGISVTLTSIINTYTRKTNRLVFVIQRYNVHKRFHAKKLVQQFKWRGTPVTEVLWLTFSLFRKTRMLKVQA